MLPALKSQIESQKEPLDSVKVQPLLSGDFKAKRPPSWYKVYRGGGCFAFDSAAGSVRGAVSVQFCAMSGTDSGCAGTRRRWRV